MRTIGLIVAFIAASLSTNAQLANGSTAPDFNLTDIDGNSHHLYEYLAEGKVVFVEFFACHCPSCWSYHNTNRLENLYQTYGPEGTDQIMVVMIEHDQWNDLDEFYGTAGNTQGDWITGFTIPKINAEGTDRTVFTDYNMTYYPMVYKICTDKTTELMDISYTTSELFQKADACPGALTIEEVEEAIEVAVDNVNRQIIIKNGKVLKSLNVINITGQILKKIEGNNSNRIDISDLSNGIYLLQIEDTKGSIVKKVYLGK